MTPEALWNRATNLVAASVLMLAGIAFLPEAFLEDEVSHKVDDGLIFVLGLLLAYWYNRASNRFSRSVVPVLFIWGALAVKLAALFLEFDDKNDVGDDFGALVLFVGAALLVTWLYRRRMPAQ